MGGKKKEAKGGMEGFPSLQSNFHHWALTKTKVNFTIYNLSFASMFAHKKAILHYLTSARIIETSHQSLSHSHSRTHVYDKLNVGLGLDLG